MSDDEFEDEWPYTLETTDALIECADVCDEDFFNDHTFFDNQVII